MAQVILKVNLRPDEAAAVRAALSMPRALAALNEEVVRRWARAVITDMYARRREMSVRKVTLRLSEEVRRRLDELARVAAEYDPRRTYKIVLLSLAAELGVYSPITAMRIVHLRLPSSEALTLYSLSARQRSELVLRLAEKVTVERGECEGIYQRDTKVALSQDAYDALFRRSNELGVSVSCVMHAILKKLGF